MVVPSLYLPATHAVQEEGVQVGRPRVVLLESLAAGLSLQRRQTDAPAALPVPAGQVWQAVLPLDGENLPAPQRTHAVPDAAAPGEHAVQVVTEPPAE